KSHGDSNSNLSREVPYSARDRFSSVANRNIGVGKENCLMNSPNCNFSDRLGAISSRNISRRKVSFQEMGTVAPNSTWKTLRYQDQFVHSPARKRYYPYPPEHYPHTPAMRSPLAPSKTPFTSTTARRKMIFWTEAEEVALREAVAKFAPNGEAAKEKRSISWVRIHEYCRESIHPTRCPDDLRKKWNRMKNKLGACPEDGSVGGDGCF
uniref:Myb-like domain-containing protein n=1 Tax=Aegilops tauschii subsp. strangulata TaxID=200361 RepID=A0A453JAD4_AEGTS